MVTGQGIIRPELGKEEKRAWGDLNSRHTDIPWFPIPNRNPKSPSLYHFRELLTTYIHANIPS